MYQIFIVFTGHLYRVSLEHSMARVRSPFSSPPGFISSRLGPLVSMDTACPAQIFHLENIAAYIAYIAGGHRPTLSVRPGPQPVDDHVVTIVSNRSGFFTNTK